MKNSQKLSRQKLDSLGCFYYKESAEPIVYGDMVLAHELTERIIKSTIFSKYLLYNVPSSSHANQKSLVPLNILEQESKLNNKNSNSCIFHLDQSESWNPKASLMPSVFFECWRHEYGSGFHVRSKRGGVMRPVTIFCHGPYLHWTSLFPLIRKGAYPFDSVICHSKACRTTTEILIDSHAEKMSHLMGTKLKRQVRVDMIPVGVDLVKFAPRSSARSRSIYGIDQNAIVILIMGRLSERSKSDVLPLLTVLREISNKHKQENIKFVFAGSEDGIYGETVRSISGKLGLNENTCKFLGRISPSDRQFVYNAADIFVSLADNIQESFGLTPLEALASGVPQVVSDWNGYRDTVQHGETGFLIPTLMPDIDGDDRIDEVLNFMMDQDNSSLCRQRAQSTVVSLPDVYTAIDALVSDKHLRFSMGEASRRRAEATRSWDNVLQSYKNLWHELYELSESMQECANQNDSLETFAKRFTPEAYGNYPTALIRNTDKIILEGFNSSSWYSLIPLFASTAKDRILANLLDSIKDIVGNEVMPIEDVVTAVAQNECCLETQVREHILWLVKYGFVSIYPGRSNKLFM